MFDINASFKNSTFGHDSSRLSSLLFLCVCFDISSALFRNTTPLVSGIGAGNAVVRASRLLLLFY